MCTIGFHEDTLWKNKEPGKKNYEVLSIGYEGNKTQSVFIGIDPIARVNLAEEIEKNEKKDIEINNNEDMIPKNELEIPPNFPVKQVVLLPAEEIPYVSSVSHNNYKSSWGGANPYLGVVTSAVRHEIKGEYNSYSKLVTEMLSKYDNIEDCVNYIKKELPKRKIRGVNIGLMDKNKKILIEYVPESLKKDSLKVEEINDGRVETNFSTLNNFFWSEDWIAGKGDLKITQHFIRSLNRYIVARNENLNINEKSKNHLLYEELFNPEILKEGFEKFKEGELDKLNLNNVIEDKSFYTICTHDKIYNIGEEEPPTSFKRTSWNYKFDGNSLEFEYDNPCISKSNIGIEMKDLETLSKKLS